MFSKDRSESREDQDISTAEDQKVASEDRQGAMPVIKGPMGGLGQGRRSTRVELGDDARQSEDRGQLGQVSWASQH